MRTALRIWTLASFAVLWSSAVLDCPPPGALTPSLIAALFEPVLLFVIIFGGQPSNRLENSNKKGAKVLPPDPSNKPYQPPS